MLVVRKKKSGGFLVVVWGFGLFFFFFLFKNPISLLTQVSYKVTSECEEPSLRLDFFFFSFLSFSHEVQNSVPF